MPISTRHIKDQDQALEQRTDDRIDALEKSVNESPGAFRKKQTSGDDEHVGNATQVIMQILTPTTDTEMLAVCD